MTILVSQCYEVITLESAEDGEAADAGFDFQMEPYTFRELIAKIERGGFTQCSCSPASGSVNEWLTAYGEQDYRDGSYTNHSLHYDVNNHPRYAKYWAKAIRYATRRGA